MPLGKYGARSIPLVDSREPLWDRPTLREEVDSGAHYLPGSVTGRRETLVTSPVAARPQYVAIVPGPGWPPVLAAVGTAAFFLLLTVKLTIPAAVGGVLALAMILVWAWGTDHGPKGGPVEVARDLRLPVYVTGPRAHAWWAMIVVIVVLAVTFVSLVFSYFYLRLVAPDGWPPAGVTLPAWGWPAAAAVTWVSSSGLVAGASRALAAGATNGFRMLLMLGAGLILVAAALDAFGQLRAELAPDRHAYGATVATFIVVQGVTALAVLMMAAYTLARSWRGRLDQARRVTFDNTRLLWHYTVAQGLVGLGLTHVIPRALG